MEQKNVPTNRLHLENKNRNLGLTIILQELFSFVCNVNFISFVREKMQTFHNKMNCVFMKIKVKVEQKWIQDPYWHLFKGYLCCETITSQIVPSKAQIKIFLMS